MAAAATKIFATACAVLGRSIAGCGVTDRRYLGLIGYRGGDASRSTLWMSAVEEAIIFDRLQAGRRQNIAVHLTGIDLNPFAARAALETTPEELGINWVTCDALAYRPEKPIDVVISSLLAHHLEDQEIVGLLGWMEATAQLGWFINDLERAKWSYRMFSWVPWHPIVRHDGPVSFRRAFREEDWLRLLTAADISQDLVTLEHWRPGRLCVGRWK
jgi:hypothetical protein